ncbi:MAG: redoxin domain-containing protein, partial [Acetobacteraceae bacterium]|nr:redoxin domain-containing protein [Acetobacteraceae bacterium]
FGVEIPFPIVEDPSMAIARAYGMISPRAPDAAMVRAVFAIDPEGIIRAITWYPMTTGRNVEELLRLVAALRTTDAHDVSTPEGWQPGQDVILPPPLTAEEAYRQHEAGTHWYYRSGPLPSAGKRRRKNG